MTDLTPGTRVIYARNHNHAVQSSARVGDTGTVTQVTAGDLPVKVTMDNGHMYGFDRSELDTSRTFTVPDLLTVITGITYTPVGRLYAILDYLTGESLFTHQLGDAGEAARPVLRERYPDLSAIEPCTSTNPLEIMGWLTDVLTEHGTTREVAPLPAGVYRHTDPLLSLVQKMNGEPS